MIIQIHTGALENIHPIVFTELVPFYIPMALALVYNNKGRRQIAIIRDIEYQVMKLPDNSDYVLFPSFADDNDRYIPWKAHATLRQKFKKGIMYNIEDMIMIHIRAVSGQTSVDDLRTQNLGSTLIKEIHLKVRISTLIREEVFKLNFLN